MDAPAYVGFLCCAVPGVLLAIALRSPVRRAWRALGRMGRVRAFAAVAAVAAVVGYGGSKGPAPAFPLAQLLTVLAGGNLVGPYTHFVASGAAEAAVVGSIGVVSNLLDECEAVVDAAQDEIDGLEDDVAALPPALWIAADMVPPAVGAPRNLYARIEGSEPVEGNRIRYFVWFAMEPALPPVMEFDVEVLPGNIQTMPAVTNSWPDTVSRDTPDGPVDCVVYEVEVPPDAQGLCLRPESQVRLGRADMPIRIPTVALTIDEVTYTPTNGWLTTGLGFDLRADGGVFIDWRGTP